MNKKRILSMLLCVMMVVTLFTGMIPAASADPSAGEMTAEGVKLNKTLSLGSDGTYTIKLEAFATGEIKTETVTESIPTDFIFIADQSGSMEDEMRASTLTKPSTSVAWEDLCHGFTSQQIEACYDGNSNFPYYYRADANDAAKFDGVVEGRDYIMYYKAELHIGSIQYHFYIYCAEANQLYLVAEPNYRRTHKVIDDEPGFYDHLYFGAKDSRNNRLDALMSAANAFVSTVKADSVANGNLNHRVAVVGFSSSGYNNTELLSGVTINRASKSSGGYFPKGYAYNGPQYGSITTAQYGNALQDISTADGKTSIDNAVNALTAYGGTQSGDGFDMAKQILANRSVTTFTTAAGETKNRNVVVIFFTDGTPGNNSDEFDTNVANSAISTSNTLKNTYNAMVYSVGVFTKPTTSINNYMQRVSSNYKNATSVNSSCTKVGSKYYITAFDANALTSAFSSISSDINHNTTSCVLDSTSILKDVISENLNLTSASKVTTASVKYGSTAKAVSSIDFSDFTGATTTLSTSTPTGKTIDASGFDYSSNYVTGAANTGSKFVVTITGLVPNKTGTDLYSNTAASGIYDKDASGNYVQVAQFGMPTFSIADKNYVIDYAQPLNVDLNQSSISISGSFVKGSATNTKFGTVSTDGRIITFTPTTMNWTGSDTVYSLGQAGGAYSWAKLNFVPANNVYYEDTFVSTDGSGIVYEGTWTTDGRSAGNEGTANTDVTAGSWKNAALGNDTGYSNGSAHMADASKGNASASFTFTGTGFDVYSRTNGTTGTIFAEVKGNGIDKFFLIDNNLEGKDFYQVPTLAVGNLAYGTYTVTIDVTAAAGTDRATYYIDGIRIYNPANYSQDSSYAETERRAKFAEVRDSIIKAETFSPSSEVDGAVFVDTVTSGATFADYNTYGPKHEVYLASGQAIVFKVDNYTASNSYYVGLSAPEGSTKATVTNGERTSPIDNIAHASDLFYKITPNSNGYIMIQNTGSNVLAVSKLCVAGSAPMMMFRTMSYAPTMSYVNTFSTLSSVPYEEDPVVDPVDPADPTDPTDPADPADPTDPADPQPSSSIIKTIVDNLFRSIKNLFKWF